MNNLSPPWWLAAALFAGTFFSIPIPGQEAATPASGTTLTQAVQIRKLSREEAGRGYGVRLNGIVTFSDGDSGLLFVQDETGGIFVAPQEPVTLQAGTRVEVTGIAQPGSHLSIVARAVLFDRGVTIFPKAKPVTFDQLATGQEDCNWIETEGVVRSVQLGNNQVRLLVVAGGKRLLVRVTEPNEFAQDISDLVDAEVRFQGVSGAPASPAAEGILLDIHVPNPRFVEVRSRATPALQAPLRTSAWLRQEFPTNLFIHRVRIRGVLENEPGTLLRVRDKTGTADLVTASLALGAMTNAEVEVVGFPGGGPAAPRLENVRVSLLSQGRLPDPSIVGPPTPEPAREFLPVLTEIDQVRRLSVEEAARGYPVRVRGVITFLHVFPDGAVRFFVQDETAGIFVQIDSINPAGLRAGSVLELEGTSDPGDFAPIIKQSSMTVSGEGNLPPARLATIEELLSGRKDSQRVRVHGIVARVQRDASTVIMGLLVGGTMVDVLVAEWSGVSAPEKLLDAAVRVDGVCGTRFNAKRQLVGVSLNIPRGEDIQVIKPAPEDPFRAPVRSVRSLSQFDLTEESGHRVRVQGTATLHVEGSGVFLQDQTDGLFVPTEQAEVLEPGDRVDVIGFPQPGRPGASLIEPRFRRLGSGAEPESLWVNSDRLSTGELNNRLVTVEAKLLERRQGTNQSVLVCQADGWIFEARGRSPTLQAAAQSLGVGSVVRLTGVWAMQGDPLPLARVARLWLRSPRDIEVIQRPPWWTRQRAVVFGGGLLAVTLATLAWVALLRREVRERTAQSRKALALLKASIAQSPSGILIADAPDVTIRWANSAALGIRGQTAELLTEIEVSRHSARWQTFRPDGTPYPATELPLSRAVLRGEVTRNEEVIIRNAKGDDRWVSANAAPIRDPDGAIMAGVVIFHDITERKQAEATLLESERKYRMLHETMRDAFARVDMAGRVVESNQAFQGMLGYSEEELRQLTYRELTPESWHAAEARILAEQVQLLGASSVYEKEYRRQDGTVFPVELRTYLIRDPAGQPSGMWAIVRDITERKQSERVHQAIAHISEVALSAQTLDQLFPLIHRIVAELMPAPNFYVALHDPGENLIRFPYYQDEMDPPGVARKAGKGLTEYVLQGGKPVLATAEQIRDWMKEGTIKTSGTVSVCWLGVPLRTQDRTIGVMAVQSYSDTIRYNERQKDVLMLMSYPVANAIERKRVEEALRESEDKFSRAFHLSPDSIDLSRLNDGVILEVNDGFTAVTGYAREEVVGRSEATGAPRFWINSADLDRFVADLRAGGEVSGLETPFRCKDGRVKTGLISARLISIKGVDCVLSITRDITERKRAEEEREKLQAQLLQAQKMESVGRLAGGVAHDFNNMLQAILGNVALAAEEPLLSSQIREHLAEIQKAAERSADLTRQLLAFARKQTVSPKVLDLNDTVSGMLKMLQRLLGEDIQLAWLPGSNLWPVKVDPSQVDQMLANLTVNARDAINGVGKISIRTGNVTVDDTQTRTNADSVVGDYVRLSVRDDGSGMSLETQAHLFEPFFTTKAAGKGTGLGLATVYGIVKQNGGFIDVQSEPGRGTTFQVHLPRVAAQAEAAERPMENRSWRGTETVLLVEDEAQVLALGERILRQHGYEVLAARLPEEAIRLAETHAGPIHLLVTDVIMPGMNGRELSQRVVAIKPGLKCLFMSGYTADVIAHQGVLEEGVEFLQKPFSIGDLTRRVRETLGTPLT